eukprot:COSAG02_NODE_408_length_22892_cov_35.212785_22_plen_703_part_00
MMRPPTKPKLPGAASRRVQGGGGSKEPPPAIDRHPADSAIRVACLPDPVKVVKKAGYPKRSVQDRLQECGMQYTQISVRDVLGGKLTTDTYDVLCIPGGYAPNWCDKLGEKGSKAIEIFVAKGGGYVGICAGAYIGSNWDLGLIDVDLPLIDRWARGKTDTCALHLTADAIAQLGEVAAETQLAVRYNNGPLMQANEGVTVLATFESELRGRRNKYPAEMKGTAAIVAGRYHGENGVEGGRVVLISPHPETDDGPLRARTIFRQLFRHAACVLDPQPQPEPEPEPEQGNIRRTASGRGVGVGAFALARQGSACSCCGDDDAQSADPKSEPEPEPEPQPLVRTRSGKLGTAAAQAVLQRQRSSTSAATPNRTVMHPQLQMQDKARQKMQPLSALPPTMADGYSVKGLPYIECAGSPILITAPHGLQVYRGSEDGERRRLHLRERWSTEIALKLAAAAPTQDCASFIVWNHKTAKKKDNFNLDPNYLTAEQQPDSPFHRGLLRFKQRDYSGLPCFHIDVHGKMDRKKNLDLDVGMGPMEEHWQEEGFEMLKEHMEEAFHEAFAGTAQFRSKKKGSVGRFSFGVEVDPRLHGYWGSDTVMTMSHQAVAEGIAAIQLEIPYTMREQLMRDDMLFQRFAAAIYAAYDAIVATGKVGAADGSVLGPQVDSTLLASDPLPQRISRQTIATMVAECKIMDTAMAGREKMI